MLKLHFTALLNLQTMITFKVVKPQHFSLSFIIYLCGLKKELLREKLPQRNSESWFGIGHSDQVRKARFFDLCSFIIPLSVFESCLCFSWSFLSPSPLFIALFFFDFLSFCLCILQSGIRSLLTLRP